MKTVRGVLTEYQLTGAYGASPELTHLQQVSFLSGVCGGIILMSEAIIEAKGNQEKLVSLIRSIDMQTQSLVAELFATPG